MEIEYVTEAAHVETNPCIRRRGSNVTTWALWTIAILGIKAIRSMAGDGRDVGCR
jgi:hypothetical protein